LAPALSNLPAIKDNNKLPAKLDTRAMRRYIHFGRMSQFSFTGKVLLEHPAYYTSEFFRSTPEIKKFLKQDHIGPYVSIKVDRFGNSKTVKAGFLFGTLLKESREDLAERIEDSIYSRSGMEIPILISREKFFDSEDSQKQFVWTTVVRCREDDLTVVSEGLNTLYGKPSPESDQLRPMLRFMPVDLIMFSDKTRLRFIQEKRALDENIIAITLRDVKDLETIIEPPPNVSTDSQTFSILSILSNLIDQPSSKKLFHAVTPHGIEENTIILASTRTSTSTIRRCRYNLTSVIQETFPWVQDSDIFENPRPPRLIVGMDQEQNRVEKENQLDSIFGCFKEDFPSLSDLDDESNEPSEYRKHSSRKSAWSQGPPTFDPPKEQIDTASYPGMSATSKFRSVPRKTRKHKKARMNDSGSEEDRGSQLSDSDISTDTRQSRLRKHKSNQKMSNTSHTTEPTPPSALTNQRNNKTSKSTTLASSPIPQCDQTSPSTLTEFDTERFLVQQQEILCLRENLQSLTENVQSLQSSILEQNQNQIRLSNSVEGLQDSLRVQQGTQSNMATAIHHLEDNQSSFSLSIAMVMQLLQKMDIKLSAIPTTPETLPNHPPGEASQGGNLKC
jgi:hypothetical protein